MGYRLDMLKFHSNWNIKQVQLHMTKIIFLFVKKSLDIILCRNNFVEMIDENFQF